MLTSNQPIQTDLELSSAPSERTEWSSGSPPCVGWWETRFAAEALNEGSAKRTRLYIRRWWNGTNYSLAVDMGSSDEETRKAQNIVGVSAPAVIEYRGLVAPPEGGYSYSLDSRARTQLAREITTRARVQLEIEDDA